MVTRAFVEQRTVSEIILIPDWFDAIYLGATTRQQSGSAARERASLASASSHKRGTLGYTPSLQPA